MVRNLLSFTVCVEAALVFIGLTIFLLSVASWHAVNEIVLHVNKGDIFCGRLWLYFVEMKYHKVLKIGGKFHSIEASMLGQAILNICGFHFNNSSSYFMRNYFR